MTFSAVSSLEILMVNWVLVVPDSTVEGEGPVAEKLPAKIKGLNQKIPTIIASNEINCKPFEPRRPLL